MIAILELRAKIHGLLTIFFLFIVDNNLHRYYNVRVLTKMFEY